MTKRVLLIFCVLYLALGHREGEAQRPRPQPRIVGGLTAFKGSFPYQVSVQLNGGHICGGSIISKDYVLTAAHCVYEGQSDELVPISQLYIRAGSIFSNFGGQRRGVSEIKAHPSYNYPIDDIALLKLAQPLKLNKEVAAIDLATEEPTSGSELTISGWGRLSEGGSMPRVLQHTTLLGLSNEDCRKTVPIPGHVICVLHGVRQGVCDGDSGGPAVLDKKLVGVANFVDGQCGTSGPDGYASVPYYRDWILKNSSD
ncbi:serine protease SP24D-like precursor [Stomoxys calcitrans]|uniref:Serine protease Ssp3-2 n=1 Tax=Stomoxys calcitrans TaxID=35570 RepID=A5WYF0_STOCA|nr:serine protease SP24D-like precursor [Stomoxys calcitrans]AAY98012.1 serine protease Ssp3-2 precursor [Stomoxys calcitrans]